MKADPFESVNDEYLPRISGLIVHHIKYSKVEYNRKMEESHKFCSKIKTCNTTFPPQIIVLSAKNLCCLTSIA